MTDSISRYLRAVLLPLLVAGCSPSASEGPDGWAGSVDTLASGRLVVSSPDSPMDATPWELRERLRLGSLSDEGPELFGRIAGVGLGPSGAIYVLDDQAAAVRVFDSLGAFSLQFGGEGEGPGELRGPVGLAVDHRGVVWVLNWGNRRYSGFAPTTGQVYDEVRRDMGFAQVPWPGAFDDDGHLVDIGLDRRREVALLRLDSAFAPVDTLGLPKPNDDDRITFRRGSQMVAALSEPFAPTPTWTPRPRGGIVVGDGAEYRLHRVTFDGDTSMTMALDRAHVRVTATEADSALAFFRQMQESLGGATPDRRPSVREVKPAHGPLFVDDKDRTWVASARSSDEGPMWDVFDREGRFKARVPVPDPPDFMKPVVRGNRLLIATQVNGFPEVVLYEISGS